MGDYKANTAVCRGDDRAIVDFIVPVYNTPEDYLRRAVASLDAQSVRVRALFMDDGSGEPTAKALDDLSKAHEWVEVVHLPHSGVSSARNAGLGRVNAPYVAFLDADDEYLPSFASEAIGILERTGADCVLGGTHFVSHDGVKTRRQTFKDGSHIKVFEGKGKNVMVSCLFDPYVFELVGASPCHYTSNWSVMYRSSILSDVRFDEDLVISEDRMFNWDAFDASQKVAVCDSVWYRYIQNENSATHKIRPDAAKELASTARAIEAHSRGVDELVATSAVKGIYECFWQAVSFSVARSGFVCQTGTGRIAYLKTIMDQDVFQRAFAGLVPRGRDYALAAWFGKRRWAAGLYLIHRMQMAYGSLYRRLFPNNSFAQV